MNEWLRVGSPAQHTFLDVFSMRTVCLIIAAISLLSAALQYNDPDPLLWAAYYLGIGLFALLSAAGYRLRLGFISLVIASVSLMLSTWPGVQQYLANQDGQTLAQAMSKEFPYIEQTREFGGAVLGLVSAIFSFTAAAYLPRPIRRRQAAETP